MLKRVPEDADPSSGGALDTGGRGVIFFLFLVSASRHRVCKCQELADGNTTDAQEERFRNADTPMRRKN